MAPAKVLHGAVRLQGFASSPTPDIQVRVACAWAGTAHASASSVATTIPNPVALRMNTSSRRAQMRAVVAWKWMKSSTSTRPPRMKLITALPAPPIGGAGTSEKIYDARDGREQSAIAFSRNF
jgi:hypothetical protein